MYHTSLGRPWAAPWALQGPPGIALGSSEGTICPQRPPRNMPWSPFDLPTFVFHPTWHSCTKALSRHTLKNNVFSLFLKLRSRCHFLTFATFGRTRSPPDPHLESGRGPFGPPCPPEISEQPPWSSWALPRVPFRLTLIDPRPTKTGLRQQRKTRFYNVQNHTFGEAWF